ncbi:RICIN domain-containing protein, partial [Streptomyces sp. 7R007]
MCRAARPTRTTPWSASRSTACRPCSRAASTTFVCARSGKALDNANTTAEGNQCVQWTLNSGATQQWTVTDLGHGYYKLVSVRSGEALDNNSTSDASTVVQRTDNSSWQWQQQWAIASLGNGGYQLVNRASGKALDNANTTLDGNPSSSGPRAPAPPRRGPRPRSAAPHPARRSRSGPR